MLTTPQPPTVEAPALENFLAKYLSLQGESAPGLGISVLRDAVYPMTPMKTPSKKDGISTNIVIQLDFSENRLQYHKISWLIIIFPHENWHSRICWVLLGIFPFQDNARQPICGHRPGNSQKSSTWAETVQTAQLQGLVKVYRTSANYWGFLISNKYFYLKVMCVSNPQNGTFTLNPAEPRHHQWFITRPYEFECAN